MVLDSFDFPLLLPHESYHSLEVTPALDSASITAKIKVLSSALATSLLYLRYKMEHLGCPFQKVYGSRAVTDFWASKISISPFLLYPWTANDNHLTDLKPSREKKIKRGCTEESWPVTITPSSRVPFLSCSPYRPALTKKAVWDFLLPCFWIVCFGSFLLEIYEVN